MQSGGAVASNPHTVTPSIMSLIGGGIALTSYHTYKVCSPSRASIMTGRYPWGVGYYDMKGDEAVPLGFKLVAELLQDAGYETHAIGKWNLGSKIKPLTPTRRGFTAFYRAASPRRGAWGIGGNTGKLLVVGNISDFNNST